MSETKENSDINYQKLFESVSGLYLVLTPDFKIVSFTDTYLQFTAKKREEILGHYLFDIFPDNPNDPNSNGVKKLTDSINKVIKEKTSNIMDIIRYDIFLPENGFSVKYWKIENSPIFNNDGQLAYIFHRPEDITEIVMLNEQKTEQIKINHDLQTKSDNMNEEFNQIAKELKSGTFENPHMTVKKAVRELETERAKLHNLLSNAPAYIFLLESPKHIFTFTNPLYQQLINNRQIIGKTIKEEWPEVEGQDFYELLDNVYNSGKPYIGMEKLFLIDKGNGVIEQRYMNLVYQPVFDINNKVSGISAYLYDVTDQVLANQKLEELTQKLFKSEDKYKKLTESLEIEINKRTLELENEKQKLTSLLNNAPALICIFEGPEHVFTFANPKYNQLYNNRDLIGKTVRVGLPELEGQSFYEILDNVYTTGKPFIGNEVPANIDRKFDGNIENLYFNFVYQPIFNKNGEVEGITAFVFEITEQVVARHKVEELNELLSVSEAKYKALSESLETKINERTEELFIANQETEYQRNKLQSLLFNAPASICLLEGPNHVFTFANPLYEKMFGKNLVGKPIAEALPVFASQGYFDILNTVYETGEAFIGKESPALFDREGNGNLVQSYFNFVYQPIFDTDNQVEGISTFIYDVTDIVNSRNEVEELNKDLERSNHELQSFAYVASHDLQEPLRTISSYSEIISRRYRNKIDENADQFIELIINAAKRMKYLIEGVLEHSKIQKRSEDKITNLNQTLESVKFNLKLSILENNVSLNYQDLPIVKAESNHMIQLFQNLISNAIKYTKKDSPPSISISAKKDNDLYLFSIKDNGIGISKEHHERIFEIFKRLHGREEYDGTGIGLASCKKIVELYGGKIWLESEEGKGSTFFFTLEA